MKVNPLVQNEIIQSQTIPIPWQVNLICPSAWQAGYDWRGHISSQILEAVKLLALYNNGKKMWSTGKGVLFVILKLSGGKINLCVCSLNMLCKCVDVYAQVGRKINAKGWKFQEWICWIAKSNILQRMFWELIAHHEIPELNVFREMQ